MKDKLSIAAILVAGMIFISAISFITWDSCRDKRILVEGQVVAVQDSFWNGSWTLIQKPDGYSVKVSGVWGHQGDKVRVRANEVR
jgi:hypothetical protein